MFRAKRRLAGRGSELAPRRRWASRSAASCSGSTSRCGAPSRRPRSWFTTRDPTRRSPPPTEAGS